MYQKAKNSWIKHIDFCDTGYSVSAGFFFPGISCQTPESEFIFQFRVWKPCHRVDPD